MYAQGVTTEQYLSTSNYILAFIHPNYMIVFQAIVVNFLYATGLAMAKRGPFHST
jgi:hypothetical protein